ncbi:uncharacterized protein J3D65DRAFT_648627 [Phyllosticta citribraziliensis]|uniref:Uncharacterized protein n=1 Tax=Phyllosticta citribraziliensis TaxID=989973 RepID=A0ABR1L2N3_9PEZI
MRIFSAALLLRATLAFFALLASSSSSSVHAHGHDYAAQQVLPNTNANDDEQPHLMASGKMASSASQSLNVLKTPLALHSLNPRTGYLRNGYCAAPPGDYGNHSVAAVVTDEFLDFTASRGNDLRVIPGMRAGCKWCLCAGRWLEAFRERERLGDRVVPRVVLEATSERALESVRLEELRAFAVDGNGGGGGGQ